MVLLPTTALDRIGFPPSLDRNRKQFQSPQPSGGTEVPHWKP